MLPHPSKLFLPHPRETQLSLSFKTFQLSKCPVLNIHIFLVRIYAKFLFIFDQAFQQTEFQQK